MATRRLIVRAYTALTTCRQPVYVCVLLQGQLGMHPVVEGTIHQQTCTRSNAHVHVHDDLDGEGVSAAVVEEYVSCWMYVGGLRRVGKERERGNER